MSRWIMTGGPARCRCWPDGRAMTLFTQAPFWRQIFWDSYIVWVVFEVWVFTRDRKRVAGTARDQGSIILLVALLVAGLILAFTLPRTTPFARMALPPVPRVIAAILLIWSGMALRLWAILTLGKFFRTSVFILAEHQLVTAGPYRLLRHPAYTGSVITFAGIGLAMGNWLSLIAILACSLTGYGWRIHVEERALRERFGESFDTNRKRTWAVIPFVW
jgi:protein-S-isoprenylcysteine O-methyltransferase